MAMLLSPSKGLSKLIFVMLKTIRPKATMVNILVNCFILCKFKQGFNIVGE